MKITDRLQARLDWIQEKNRGGHDYHAYYADDTVYANIKNYNFADRDAIKANLPKKYHAYFDKLSDEYISDLEWEARNRDAEDMLELAPFEAEEIGDAKAVGVYGRSGGWLGLQNTFCSGSALETMLEQLNLKPLERDYTPEDVKQALKSWNKLQALLEKIEEYARGYDYTDLVCWDLKDNYVPSWDDELKRKEELKTAKTLAKKHGYILAKEV